MRRPSESRLRRTFADILLATAAVGAAVVGSAACGGASTTLSSSDGDGGTEGGRPPTTLGFTTLCGPATNPTSFLASLRATPALDGAVWRTETAFTRRAEPNQPGNVAPDPEALGDSWSGQNGETTGTLCASAKDRAACLAKAQGFRVLPPSREQCASQYAASQYTSFDCSTSYILYTRGDAIGIARTNDEIKALISTFDTLGEVMWAAENAGYTRSCSGSYDNTPDSEYRATPDGGWDLTLVNGECEQELFKVLVHVDYAGNITILSKEGLGKRASCPVAGRRPTGLRSGPLAANARPIGEHFASMATLEAASVTAFRRLHRQLAAHGAPRELLARVRQAARDEIRHARATSALARKYGVTPAAPEIATEAAAPSLLDIALENAREGCVRETYGALVAQLQKHRAADEDVRAVMVAVADEETEHAALSWDIAEWIETQLGETDRALLVAERRAAFVQLASELTHESSDDVRHVSGVPAARDALRMLEGLGPMMLAA